MIRRHPRPARLRHLPAAGLVAALVLGLPTASLGDTSRFKAAGSVGSFHWEPTRRTITKGDRIVWKNPTTTEHRVTAYGGNWSKDTGIAANGGKTSQVFSKTGTYRFRCTINEGTAAAHSTLSSSGACSGMCGKVRVTS